MQEVQNQARDGNLFDYFYAKPVPIAPQSLTKEIPERCGYAGNVLLALDEDAVATPNAAAETDLDGVRWLLDDDERGFRAGDLQAAVDQILGVSGASTHPDGRAA